MTVLAFDAATHRYTLDGVPARSVTGILRKVGLVNFDAIPPSILERARRRGTAVHSAIHYFNENDLDVEHFTRTFPDYAGYLGSWMRLVASGRLQAALCEHRVACASPRYTGTFDWLGCFDGAGALIDYATGDPEDSAKHLQTAAYVIAAQTWAHEPGQAELAQFFQMYPHVRRFSVRLDRFGGLPTITPYTDPRDFSKFRLLAQAVAVVDDERPRTVPWDWQQETPHV